MIINLKWLFPGLGSLLCPSSSSSSTRYNNLICPLVHFYERRACFKHYMPGNVRDISIEQSESCLIICIINKISLLRQHSGDYSDIYTVTTLRMLDGFGISYIIIAVWSTDPLFFLPYHSLSLQQFSSFQGTSWFYKNLDMSQRKALTSDN